MTKMNGIYAKYAIELFKFGHQEMKKKGLILVDKYEFGKDENGIILFIRLTQVDIGLILHIKRDF